MVLLTIGCTSNIQSVTTSCDVSSLFSPRYGKNISWQRISQIYKKWAAILTYTFLKYTLALCTKVYLILGVCTKVYLKNLATLDADTKVYLE